MINNINSNRISGLIAELQKALDKYGDLPVGCEGSEIGYGSTWRWSPINVEGYDVESYPETGKAVEIFLEGY